MPSQQTLGFADFCERLAKHFGITEPSDAWLGVLPDPPEGPSSERAKRGMLLADCREKYSVYGEVICWIEKRTGINCLWVDAYIRRLVTIYDQFGWSTEVQHFVDESHWFLFPDLRHWAARLSDLDQNGLTAELVAWLADTHPEMPKALGVSTDAQQPADAGDEKSANVPRIVSREKFQILTALKGRKTLAQVPDLVAATGLSAAAVKSHRAELLADKLIDTPEGERKGVCITTAGLAITAVD